MSQFKLSLAIALALIVPSGAVTLWFASQPDLTDYQVQVLKTSSQICYGGSETVFKLLVIQQSTRRKSLKKAKE